MFNLLELELVESSMMIKDIKIPKRRHKSKRIQKKWNKIYGFKSILIPDPEVYVFQNKIIGHPKTLEKIEKLSRR